MNTKLTTGAIGLLGTGASEIAQNIDFGTINEGAGILTQIVILVVTLIGLFKKKKVS